MYSQSLFLIGACLAQGYELLATYFPFHHVKKDSSLGLNSDSRQRGVLDKLTKQLIIYCPVIGSI